MPTTLFAVGLAFAVLTAVSLWPPRRPGTLALAGWFAGWLISELPLHQLVVQLTAAAMLISLGGLDAPLGWLGLALTAASAIGLLAHVRTAGQAAGVIDGALRELEGTDPAAAARTSRLARATVFPFRPRDVTRTADIVYHRIGRRSLRLDVYRPHGLAADARAPVFVYVHGGAWVIGNKGQQGRVTVHRLARAGWVCVSVNYRLSPRATFPDHLLDVKRALRWVKEQIAAHGGDPDFVVIGGGSAGAHLASLAALTANVVEYQRDFPEVDTTVQGCVGYYGVYDLADRERAVPHRAFRDLLMERIVMKRRFADAPEEFDKASPQWRIAHATAIPPFMLLHGDRDSLAPLAGAHRFRDGLRAASPAPVVWAELPGAQHAFELFPSRRADAAVAGVARFCAAIHARHRAATASAADQGPRDVNADRARGR